MINSPVVAGCCDQLEFSRLMANPRVPAAMAQANVSAMNSHMVLATNLLTFDCTILATALGQEARRRR